jgi:hypothetical protein
MVLSVIGGGVDLGNLNLDLGPPDRHDSSNKLENVLHRLAAFAS